MVERKHIGYLQQGTVIDHIANEHVFDVIELLQLNKIQNFVFVGFNLESDKLGKKALIKIENLSFHNPEVLAVLSLLSPEATVNIIKDEKVIEKKKIILPEKLLGLLKCNNYNCITNKEAVETQFIVKDAAKRIVQCFYCEEILGADKIQFKRG